MTCGPTWVPIDAVRVISNISTGELGRTLAGLLDAEGAQVTVLQGPTTRELQGRSIRVIPFCFYDELTRLMNIELRKHYDIIIHAAAVSDYKLAHPFKKKISSRLSRLKLDLTPTAKIIEKIKKISPSSFLVGFKLESERIVEAAHCAAPTLQKLFTNARCDLVVVNSLTKNNYSGHILDPKKNVLATAQQRKELSRKLIHLLRERI